MERTTSHGLSDTICRHIAGLRFTDLPDTTIAATKHVILDATGVIYAASGISSDVLPFITLAHSQGPGPCHILGTGQQAAAGIAALANGAMAHALDFEDTYDATPSHPNASMIPAALAIAQAYGPIDGRSFITALAVGCDLVCRLGESLLERIDDNGWYSPPILGAVGAAAACAKLLRLDWQETRDALSIVLCQVSAPGEIKHSHGTVLRAVREAFPAQAAVLAALLAQNGVRGFEEPLEGKGGFFVSYAHGRYDPQVLLDRLGTRFGGDDLSFKRYPTCRGTHPFIDMALRLQAKHGFTVKDIEAITVHHDSIQQMLVTPVARKRSPSLTIDAKFSIPYTLATAIVRGDVTLQDFDARCLVDPQVLEISGKVSGALELRPPWTLGSGGAMTINLTDGRVLQDQTMDAPGSPARPLSRDDLREKFIHCLGSATIPRSRQSAAAMADSILQCETSADIGALFASG